MEIEKAESPCIYVCYSDHQTLVDQDEVKWSYDLPTNIVNQDEEQDTDETKYLTIDSPELRYLKLFLMITLQKIPKQLSNRYNFVLYSVQLIVVLAVFVHYLHVLGVFREKTLVEEEMRLTLTSFKNVVWNLRNPLLTTLGFLYFSRSHLDDMLANLRLTSHCLKGVRWRLKLCFALEIVFAVVLPGCTNLVQMWFLPTVTEAKKFTKEEAIMNTVLLVLARLLALPIVITFITEFYLLYYHVRQYKKKIQAWDASLQVKARNYFLDIQTEIKKAEKSFQSFLIIDIAILLLIFVPSILCYIERFNSEGSYTQTLYTVKDNTIYNPAVNWINMGQPKSDPTNFKNQSLFLLIKIPTTSQSEDLAKKYMQKRPDKKAQERIVLEAITFLGELLALYLPIVLLGKINKVLSCLPQTIRCLKFDEQNENGYLFQSWQIVKVMSKDFQNAQGVHILGMQLTVIKTVLVAFLAPFLTLLFHILVKRVDITT